MDRELGLLDERLSIVWIRVNILMRGQFLITIVSLGLIFFLIFIS